MLGPLIPEEHRQFFEKPTKTFGRRRELNQLNVARAYNKPAERFNDSCVLEKVRTYPLVQHLYIPQYSSVERCCVYSTLLYLLSSELEQEGSTHRSNRTSHVQATRSLVGS